MKRAMLTFMTICLFAGTALAVPINANFSDYPLAPTTTGQTDLDTVYANDWFYNNYGITFSNAYLYYDSRDTFDHIGIANDITGPGSTGWIYFADTTNFVTVDWTTISAQDIYLSVFDRDGNLQDSYFYDAITNISSGTITLTGTAIASLSFHDGGGQVGLSTLMYDFDGTTDGTNNDTNPVPEPSTMLLLGGGLAGLAFWRRMKRQ